MIRGIVRAPVRQIRPISPADAEECPGVLFRVDAAGTYTKLHDFNWDDGAGPTAPLVVGPDGALYGVTAYGGSWGVIFRMETGGAFTKLHDFTGPDGIALDSCPGSSPGGAVNPDGCSIDQLASCSGPRTGGAWRNHGQYVSTVTQIAEQFRRAGLITETQRRAIVNEAARSSCGNVSGGECGLLLRRANPAPDGPVEAPGLITAGPPWNIDLSSLHGVGSYRLHDRLNSGEVISPLEPTAVP